MIKLRGRTGKEPNQKEARNFQPKIVKRFSRPLSIRNAEGYHMFHPVPAAPRFSFAFHKTHIFK
jgi:hypothetical protein